MLKIKNPAAVSLGRLGGRARAARLTREELSAIGRKGGNARKRRISAERRREIAQIANAARWKP